MNFIDILGLTQCDIDVARDVARQSLEANGYQVRGDTPTRCQQMTILLLVRCQCTLQQGRLLAHTPMLGQFTYPISICSHCLPTKLLAWWILWFMKVFITRSRQAILGKMIPAGGVMYMTKPNVC